MNPTMTCWILHKPPHHMKANTVFTRLQVIPNKHSWMIYWGNRQRRQDLSCWRMQQLPTPILHQGSLAQFLDLPHLSTVPLTSQLKTNQARGVASRGISLH